ncbi:DJ-1/PfpI family protein [Fulvivirga lutea]|uniref:DJ-1/PfpI family protein n=1 Tax=Fulvivirga lutea TaxID=2810512 RepID=A0A974WJL6_9BACT|nr:DJ-1/PfpI family protein [Fulvivirga lutea]QSE98357.1 DJ-1/PfpI family protein [Fulvivirga lutea]
MKKIGLLILSILFLHGCANNQEPSNSSDIEMPQAIMPSEKYNVAFVIVNGVYNSELVAPMDILHHTVYHTEPRMKVFTVAPDTTLITTFEGLKIKPDYSFASAQLPDINVLVVPSAEHSMSSDLENDELINFVKEKGNAANYVMSLCDGAFVLAQAGLVDGKESTTFPSDIDAYAQRFPQLKVHKGVSFVHDGKLITSVGGAKSYDPALYLSELLYGKKAAEGLARGLVIDWDINSIKFVRVAD